MPSIYSKNYTNPQLMGFASTKVDGENKLVGAYQVDSPQGKRLAFFDEKNMQGMAKQSPEWEKEADLFDYTNRPDVLNPDASGQKLPTIAEASKIFNVEGGGYPDYGGITPRTDTMAGAAVPKADTKLAMSEPSPAPLGP